MWHKLKPSKGDLWWIAGVALLIVIGLAQIPPPPA